MSLDDVGNGRSSNRFQIVLIDRMFLLDFIEGRMRITNIPNGAVVDAIWSDFVRDKLCLRISHPSFDVVAMGQSAKHFPAQCELVGSDTTPQG